MLAYPLIQTILGVIRLNLVDNNYLLRIILVNMLNDISKSTGIYSPTPLYLLEILDSNHFKFHFKDKSILNLYNINVSLKIKKEDFKNFKTCDYIIEQTFDSLLEFLSINISSISFPEICSTVLSQVRKIYKNICDKSLKDHFKFFFEKCELSINYLENKRREIPYCMLEEKKVKIYESKI